MREPDEIVDYTTFGKKQRGIYRWRRGKEILYVGMSTNLPVRIITHHQIDCAEPFGESDVIELWFYPDADWFELEAIEAELIRQDKPKYNVTHARKPAPYGSKSGKKWRRNQRELRNEQEAGDGETNDDR
jgi:predicted GIY-YIG superfamily endonuclease